MSSVGCLIRSNPDIAGVGVRIAVYAQNILCFFPGLWAISDGTVSNYELESMDNMSTTNLVVAFGILISSFIQARTLGLTNFHTSIVLSMSWTNNTNVFIYFLLYAAQLKNKGRSWIWHLKNDVISGLHLPKRFLSPMDLEQNQKTGHTPETPASSQHSTHVPLFRSVALILGSLHLTLMSVLGIWLWSDPRGFGTSDSSCAVDHAHLAIVGVRVPFGSNALRIISLVIYVLFLVPGLNLLLPTAFFLGIYFLHGEPKAGATLGSEHQEAAAAFGSGTQQENIESTAPPATPPLAPPNSKMMRIFKHISSAVKLMSSPKSDVFPAFVGLCILLAINIVFIVDIELTLRNNRGIQESGEAEWGFGQVLAVLLLFLPLRDLVEMIFRRRQELQTQMDNAFKAAISSRNFKEIRKWVTAGVNINLESDGGETAFEAACIERNTDVLDFLVKNGVDVTRPFKSGMSRLEGLCQGHQWETVGSLVDKGIDIDIAFTDGSKALQAASSAQQWDIVKALVKKGVDVNNTFTDGKRVLEVASMAKKWDMVCFLVEKGANVNVVFINGSSALEAAAVALKWDVLHVLVDVGANASMGFTNAIATLEAVSSPQNWDVLCAQRGMDVNTDLADGETVLEAAIRTRDWEGARVLGKLGAKVSPVFKDTAGKAALKAAVDARDKKAVCALAASGCVGIEEGQIELDQAIRVKDWESVRFLVGLKADGKLVFRDGYESTVLKTSAGNQKWDLVLEIVDAGADVNMPVTDPHDTVLHLACESECEPAVIEQLLQKGANPNAKNRVDLTALHKACWHGREDFVPLLLAYGADLHLRTELGNTPLHYACYCGHDKCVELLLKHQSNPADPNTKNDDGMTPLHQAYWGGEQRCVKLLLENGADETMKDRDDRTPCLYARS